MRLLTFIFVSVIIKSAFAEAPKPLKCTLNIQHQCNTDKCAFVVPKVWIEIDVAKAQYKRCDSKGCDSYDLDAVQSGEYLNFRTKSNNGMFAKMDGQGNFMEAVSLMLYTNVSYGSCKAKK